MRPLYTYLFIILNFCLGATKPSIIFKENKGQWPQKVLFGSEFLNTKFYINKNSFNYCVYNYKDLEKAHEDHHLPEKNSVIHGHNYEVNFVGGNLTKFIKKNELSEYYNYFLGNDRTKWANTVKAFKAIQFKEVYKGIDLNIYSNELNLKYDFIISPNANSDLIRLNYNYVDGIEIRNNELIIKTSVGEIIEKAPLTYQIIKGKKEAVKCNYVLIDDKTVGFEFPNGYDKSVALIIDPVVVVCSYSGFTAYGSNFACTFDDNGNIYNFGSCGSGYPTTPGAFQLTGGAPFGDIVISAYSSSGSSKIFSTYLGGDSTDVPLCGVIKNNEINLVGLSYSKNYPHTLAAFDTTLNGPDDFVITKLNLSGTSLLASTYVGGSSAESYNTFQSGAQEYRYNAEIVCDTSGNVYICSETWSSDFPTTSGAYSSNLKGTTDACIFKMNKTLSNLVWSTYLGGTYNETCKGLRMDGSGGAYCFGTTNSANFPTTAGSYAPTKGGSFELFITHLNPIGNIIASTYLGTASADFAGLIDLDQNNNVYVCGNLSSAVSLTPTPGVYSNSNGCNSIFKLNPSLSNLIYKTKYGNYVAGQAPNLYVTAFRVDSCQSIYISGWGANTFPTTPNRFQSYGGGGTDLYFAVFSPNCTSLKFASFFGGPVGSGGQSEHSDGGISHFDNKGCLYQAICTEGGLPTTINAYAPNFVNTTTLTTTWNDAFVKIDFQTYVNAMVNSSYGGDLTACPPYTANLISSTNTGTSFWNFGDGSPIDTSNSVIHNYSNLGNYNIVLVVTDTSTCNKIDSVKTLLSVIPPTEFDLGPDRFICINNKIKLQSPVSAVTYLWNTGETTSSIIVTQPGTHTLIINNGGCNSYDDVNVVIGEDALTSIFPNVVTPNSDGVNDFIDLGIYNFSELDFTVYDRWGKQMFHATEANVHWSPNDYSDGTYFYVVSYKSDCTGEHKRNKGYISVLK